MQSSAYHKIGINVLPSFQRLFNDCMESCRSSPFLGHVNLGKMAQEHMSTSYGAFGMENLCSAILCKCIPQNPAICISTMWKQQDLPITFINHVTTETFGIWAAYTALCSMHHPQEVSADT